MCLDVQSSLRKHGIFGHAVSSLVMPSKLAVSNFSLNSSEFEISSLKDESSSCEGVRGAGGGHTKISDIKASSRARTRMSRSFWPVLPEIEETASSFTRGDDADDAEIEERATEGSTNPFD